MESGARGEERSGGAVIVGVWRRMCAPGHVRVVEIDNARLGSRFGGNAPRRVVVVVAGFGGGVNEPGVCASGDAAAGRCAGMMAGSRNTREENSTYVRCRARYVCLNQVFIRSSQGEVGVPLVARQRADGRGQDARLTKKKYKSKVSRALAMWCDKIHVKQRAGFGPLRVISEVTVSTS